MPKIKPALIQVQKINGTCRRHVFFNGQEISCTGLEVKYVMQSLTTATITLYADVQEVTEPPVQSRPIPDDILGEVKQALESQQGALLALAKKHNCVDEYKYALDRASTTYQKLLNWEASQK